MLTSNYNQQCTEQTAKCRIQRRVYNYAAVEYIQVIFIEYILLYVKSNFAMSNHSCRHFEKSC